MTRSRRLLRMLLRAIFAGVVVFDSENIDRRLDSWLQCCVLSHEALWWYAEGSGGEVGPALDGRSFAPGAMEAQHRACVLSVTASFIVGRRLPTVLSHRSPNFGYVLCESLPIAA